MAEKVTEREVLRSLLRVLNTELGVLEKACGEVSAAFWRVARAKDGTPAGAAFREIQGWFGAAEESLERVHYSVKDVLRRIE